MSEIEKAASALVQAFFAQDANYYSESGETIIQISDMHPRYAGNAANRLLQDAASWSRASGVTPRHPQIWMAGQPLFQALVKHAGTFI